MSDLRDLAAALSAISTSLTSIEGHVAEQVANGEQLRLGMHDLRSKVHASLLQREEADRNVEQIQTWLGDYGKKLGALSDSVGVVRARVETLADDVVQGFRADRAKLRDLAGQDEVTQA